MDNKISDIIRTSLENVKEIVDSNTVIGEAVPTSNGTVIIPVSKVSIGIATGGLDYKGKNKEANKPNNFGGAGGTGVSVKPVAFLIVKNDGNVELLNVDNPTIAGTDDTVEMIASFIKKSPDIISKIKSVFKKDNSEGDKAAE
ncbi:MAG: sporulation protein YtfJ [Clostridia bacterium]|nr:sporulation protein YtfJ [Clostridia bacterium]